MRSDDAMEPVDQNMVRKSQSSSLENRLSRSPPVSAQRRYFSTR
jgi:hypothetical protein